MRMMNKYLAIINFGLFQMVWLACVLGSARGYPWLGTLLLACSLLWHFSQASNKSQEAKWCVVAGLIGAVFDQILLSLNIIQYHNNGWSQSIVPVWIITLWIAFAMTLNVSMRWLRGQYAIALLFGAIGGPLAYLGAEKIGAVTLTSNSLIALGVGWSIVTVVFSSISTHYDGFERRYV